MIRETKVYEVRRVEANTEAEAIAKAFEGRGYGDWVELNEYEPEFSVVARIWMDNKYRQ